MSYEPRPNPSGDTLVRSRDTIRGNFEIIQSRFQDNHSTFGSGTGHHERIDLNEQTTFPETSADESWLATREYNTRTELAWRPESTGATGDQFILSAMPIRASATFIINVGVALQVLLGRSFNVTSITRDSEFRYTVVMPTALPSTDYWIVGQTQSIGGTSQDFISINYSVGLSTTQFTLRPNSGNNAQGHRLNFLVFGG